jgi:hypothetical protein
MRFGPTTGFSALLAITMLTLVGCDTVQTTAPPDDATAEEAPLAALGREGGAITLPVRFEATFIWNVDQSAEAVAACPGTPGIAVGGGSGTGTHLGAFEITRLDHCSIDLVPPVGLEDISREGEFKFEAPDGSTLFGTYAFLAIPMEEGGYLTMVVEGGTGRLRGATGSFDVVSSPGPTVCDDALCLENAVFLPTLEGVLTLPRP